MFMLVSVLAGILVAGLTIPAAALTGVGSGLVSDSLSDLPDILDLTPQAQRTTVYLANGQVLAQFYDENRVIVSLEQIAPIMQKAQVAIEDDRFFEHGALDLKSLVKAVLSYFTTSDGGGGSTLTQQYVKQVLVEQAATITDPTLRQQTLDAVQARTPQRKIQEARYAIWLEKRMSKDQILENYLNIAYYGDGAYGVEAAAHHYFNVSAANLDLAQAAMLAGIVQTPSRNPVSDLQGSIDRRNVVLDRMAQLNIITQADADAAKKETFDIKQVKDVPNGCVMDPSSPMAKYSVLCQYVRNTLLANPALGDTVDERTDAILRGGYSVYTYIDPKFQDSAQAAVLKMAAPTDPVVATFVEVEPGTGKIMAMAQNRYIWGDDTSKGQTQWIYTVEQAMGGAEGYQAGSTFKGFTTAAALTLGISPNKTFNAAYKMNFGGIPFKTCDGTVTVPDWPVVNASPSGVMDMYTGAAQSVNTYFVQLEEMTGICEPLTIAKAAGVKMANGDDLMNHQVPSFTLGSLEVTPLSMATAYATFASGGVHCDPVIIKQIKDGTGANVPTQQPNCSQVISKDVANGVNYVLSHIFHGGTATGFAPDDNRPISGKSGTTDDNRAAWLMGYAPNIVGAATIAVDPNPLYTKFWDAENYSMAYITLPSGKHLTGVGSYDGGTLWDLAMNPALKNLPVETFTMPPASILNGKPLNPPDTSGMSAATAKKTLEAAGFFIKTTQVYDDSPVNTYLGVSCDHIYGGNCTQTFSKGPRPAPPPPVTPPPVTSPTSPDTTAPGGTGTDTGTDTGNGTGTGPG